MSTPGLHGWANNHGQVNAVLSRQAYSADYCGAAPVPMMVDSLAAPWTSPGVRSARSWKRTRRTSRDRTSLFWKTGFDVVGVETSFGGGGGITGLGFETNQISSITGTRYGVVFYSRIRKLYFDTRRTLFIGGGGLVRIDSFGT